MELNLPSQTEFPNIVLHIKNWKILNNTFKNGNYSEQDIINMNELNMHFKKIILENNDYNETQIE